MVPAVVVVLVVAKRRQNDLIDDAVIIIIVSINLDVLFCVFSSELFSFLFFKPRHQKVIILINQSMIFQATNIEKYCYENFFLSFHIR